MQNTEHWSIMTTCTQTYTTFATCFNPHSETANATRIPLSSILKMDPVHTACDISYMHLLISLIFKNHKEQKSQHHLEQRIYSVKYYCKANLFKKMTLHLQKAEIRTGQTTLKTWQCRCSQRSW